MEKVALEDVDVEVNPLEVHSVRKPVSQVLDTDHFAMNYFELEPGESFSGGMHAHHDQEEVFYVETGEATFDLLPEPPEGPDHDPEGETVTVEGRELVRFAPGEFQTGYNSGGERLVGWALGAPGDRHDWDELESVVHCVDCGGETVHDVDLTDEGRFRVVCTECGAVQGE